MNTICFGNLFTQSAYSPIAEHSSPLTMTDLELVVPTRAFAAWEFTHII